MIRLLLLLLFIYPLPLVAQSSGDDEAALAAIRKLENLLRSETNISTYRMRVVTPDWQREMRMESWDDRQRDSFFIRILEPKKDRDTTFLKAAGNLWMYMPKLERDIRIPPSMMLSSWMGSDFTNDDLVKSSSVVDDYVHKLIAEDRDSITIESRPIPEAAVVWDKLVHRIGRDGMPIRADYYDAKGKLLRVMRFEAVRSIGGRTIPTRWIIEPTDKPGHRTVMEIEQVKFDAPIPAATFERANLRRRQ